MSKEVSVAILGSTGYVGLELVKILSKHQNVKIVFLGTENTPNTSINKFDSSINAKDLPLTEINNEFNYNSILKLFGITNPKLVWIIFVPIIIFIISAVSNGANLTDGIDGLAAGISAIIVFTLGIFAWVSGNIKFADYLNIMYIPDIGEISIFIAAFLGSLIGFLWHNTYPASVFMGDTGSLTIGALISVIAIMVRKELLIPLLCGVFLIEIFSVIIQVFYFKYTKKKSGEGIRIFKMSPIHHHFQKLGYHESKIVARFWIIGILLAVLTIVTLKLR